MCLGVPGKVLQVDGPVAIVDFFGVTREIRLDVVDAPVSPGDYVLNHVGYAIRRIPASEIGETLKMYELLLAEANREANEDLMAADVAAEMAGAAGGGRAPRIEVDGRRNADQDREGTGGGRSR